MPPTEEEQREAIVNRFKQLINDRETLASSVIDREQEVEEHNLVLKTLEHQDGSKKAWRLVGDVLVERTVAEVIPEVTKQRDNLMALAQNTRKQLEAKQKEVLEFQEKYSIRIKGQESGPGSGNGPKAAADQSGAGPSSGQGVLVSDS